MTSWHRLGALTLPCSPRQTRPAKLAPPTSPRQSRPAKVALPNSPRRARTPCFPSPHCQGARGPPPVRSTTILSATKLPPISHRATSADPPRLRPARAASLTRVGRARCPEPPGTRGVVLHATLLEECTLRDSPTVRDVTARALSEGDSAHTSRSQPCSRPYSPVGVIGLLSGAMHALLIAANRGRIPPLCRVHRSMDEPGRPHRKSVTIRALSAFCTFVAWLHIWQASATRCTRATRQRHTHMSICR